MPDIGTRAFDAIGEPAPCPRLKADGWSGRTFYICQSNLTQIAGKITELSVAVGRMRVQACHDADMWVLLNYEASNVRWAGGAAAGRIDGTFSGELATSLGYPQGLAILVAFDTDTRDKHGQVLPAALDYGNAFADALRPYGYTFGAYGGTPLLHALADVSFLNWQAISPAWSPPGAIGSTTVHMRQRRPTSAEVLAMPYTRPTPTTWSLDANDCLAGFLAWTSTPTPAPPPPPPPAPTPAPTPAPPPAPTPQPETDDDMLSAIAVYQTGGTPRLIAGLYSGGYKVPFDLAMVGHAQDLARLSGRDLSNHVIVNDDPDMWRTFGPVLDGVYPPGIDAATFDRFGVPL